MEKTQSPKHSSNKTELPPSLAGAPAAEVPHGQGLLARVNARKEELAETLKMIQGATPKGEEETTRANEIQKALLAVDTLLTGDLHKIDEANAAALSLWLESSAVLRGTEISQPAHQKSQPQHAAASASAPIAKGAPPAASAKPAPGTH